MHPCAEFAQKHVQGKSLEVQRRAASNAGSALLEQSTRHQENGLAFSAAEDGCGGVYIVRGANDKNVAVFKPSDEEVLHYPHIFLPLHTFIVIHDSTRSPYHPIYRCPHHLTQGSGPSPVAAGAGEL